MPGTGLGKRAAGIGYVGVDEDTKTEILYKMRALTLIALHVVGTIPPTKHSYVKKRP